MLYGRCKNKKKNCACWEMDGFERESNAVSLSCKGRNKLGVDGGVGQKKDDSENFNKRKFIVKIPL